MKGTAIRVAGCVEFLPACSSAVLGEIGDECETERVCLNMEASSPVQSNRDLQKRCCSILPRMHGGEPLVETVSEAVCQSDGYPQSTAAISHGLPCSKSPVVRCYE